MNSQVYIDRPNTHQPHPSGKAQPRATAERPAVPFPAWPSAGRPDLGCPCTGAAYWILPQLCRARAGALQVWIGHAPPPPCRLARLEIRPGGGGPGNTRTSHDALR